MRDLKWGSDLEIRLAIYWSARIMYWLNWAPHKLYELEDELEFMKKCLDKKYVKKQIETLIQLQKDEKIFNNKHKNSCQK